MSQSSDPAPEVVLDARGLRALAHPVRVQVLGLLRRYGPATATQLAQRMGLTSGATSYHLRQLGAAGFVEEDTSRGNARDRWWRAAHRMTRLNDPALVEREPEAALGYLRSVATAYALRVQQAVDEAETLPAPWRRVLNLSDTGLLLTPDEADQLHREIWEVVGRYRRNVPEEAAGAPAGAGPVSLMTHVLPEPADEP
ncbi:ArsR/SmtB family transcription factor [Streptomyces litchfieldiae]|uniref:Helix-turn-helix domain-containing protein n=1 Tax=Streptomyces litchfieldiae TaxID=3075543 RepID=A0ABU2MVQ1_9ACTN|nr:helix-turn-helix domain-containing protein [Streptomyces sp. DSM 44938]MDT0345179.1 helix-turn-helix domain-containing protein [Streptomyces sp. DSM 44938]